MPLRKLKYPLLALMLHALFISCGVRYEVASISHYKRGCFFGASSELTLFRERGKLMAMLSMDGHLLELNQLDDRQWSYFNAFVGELMKRKEEVGCTLEEEYSLTMNGINYHYRDGSCDWNGFDTLCAGLFKEPTTAEVTPP